MLPVFAELAKEFTNVVMLKIDVDECEDIAVEYNINFMPTFFFIKRKNVITSYSGGNADKLRKAIVQKM
nr:unnamed protein product [Callosobruchus analis]